MAKWVIVLNDTQGSNKSIEANDVKINEAGGLIVYKWSNDATGQRVHSIIAPGYWRSVERVNGDETAST